MRTTTRAIVVTLAILAGTAPATSAARPEAASRHHCAKTLTIRMFDRALNRVYAGTRTPPRGAYGHLWRYARCQRPPSSEGLARVHWSAAEGAWERRRYDAQFVEPNGCSPPACWSGRTSTFGPPSDGSGTTADGGTDDRPCIALRSSSTLGHMFLVTIYGHSARLIQCDWGPASWTGVAIDVTGAGDEALGLAPGNYYGSARELR